MPSGPFQPEVDLVSLALSDDLLFLLRLFLHRDYTRVSGRRGRTGRGHLEIPGPFPAREKPLARNSRPLGFSGGPARPLTLAGSTSFAIPRSTMFLTEMLLDGPIFSTDITAIRPVHFAS